MWAVCLRCLFASPAARAEQPSCALLARTAISEVTEPAAKLAAAAIQSTSLHLPRAVACGPVEASFCGSACEAQGEPPVVLLHSFDSSCLEYRRVRPLDSNKARSALPWILVEHAGGFALIDWKLWPAMVRPR